MISFPKLILIGGIIVLVWTLFRLIERRRAASAQRQEAVPVFEPEAGELQDELRVGEARRGVGGAELLGFVCGDVLECCDEHSPEQQPRAIRSCTHSRSSFLLF